MFTLVDRGSGQRYVVPVKSTDEATVRLLLDNREKEWLTVYTDEFRVDDPLGENLNRESVIHGDGEYVDRGAHVNTRDSLVTVTLAAQRRLKGQTDSDLRPFQLRRQILRKPSREALEQIVRAVF